jgi:hypothetical protein
MSEVGWWVEGGQGRLVITDIDFTIYQTIYSSHTQKKQKKKFVAQYFCHSKIPDPSCSSPTFKVNPMYVDLEIVVVVV